MAARFAPGSVIAVKWPNDVLADGRKLSGISAGDGGPIFHGSGLVIGIGVNLESHPEAPNFPAISLGALGARSPSLGRSVALLATGFAGWYEVWLAEGFALSATPGWRGRRAWDSESGRGCPTWSAAAYSKALMLTARCC